MKLLNNHTSEKAVLACHQRAFEIMGILYLSTIVGQFQHPTDFDAWFLIHTLN